MAAIPFSHGSTCMSDFPHKRKMISVRLSEVEYELLKTQYRTYGARSVSDLARLALEHIMTGPAASKDGLAEKVARLDDRVHTLESQVSLFVERGR
jgi:hypothetical protein